MKINSPRLLSQVTFMLLLFMSLSPTVTAQPQDIEERIEYINSYVNTNPDSALILCEEALAGKLGKDNKHQVAISNETFDRVERTARFFGGPGYSVSNLVEHIINEHRDNNAANYEGWFTLISKSF